jgi:Partial alpha/beta-hydrolase lipase region
MIKIFPMLMFLSCYCLLASTSIFEIQYEDEVSNYPLDSKDEEKSEAMMKMFEEWRTSKLRADPDSLPTPDMIRSYGYNPESYDVLTKDGYINTLHRITPKGKYSLCNDKTN